MLDEYDRKKLIEARKMICKVYDYYYGDPHTRKEQKRLETVINKLDDLIGQPRTINPKE